MATSQRRSTLLVSIIVLVVLAGLVVAYYLYAMSQRVGVLDERNTNLTQTVSDLSEQIQHERTLAAFAVNHSTALQATLDNNTAIITKYFNSQRIIKQDAVSLIDIVSNWKDAAGDHASALAYEHEFSAAKQDAERHLQNYQAFLTTNNQTLTAWGVNVEEEYNSTQTLRNTYALAEVDINRVDRQ